ncbi:heme ABC transporter ATP-binding protein [Shewanella sp. D64]|uniref:heme ABC transporter ATP-binding protein n=1 Tax=unclassified Shewanella TaxID=196818 RepID=UPI0022BA3741|nr:MULTISPECIES: heme ABC transporter ATP-binding protein [unclassified Shewanella]MEC4724993.1 heme ABC transporter ATP-binding protein [Shewanella sp. D64]MEC4736894.1 heme ABC transporter ATP-binding protein [Shewanella sp. E94]WBJ96491.1 heme ABC transporter ATP-binding protein [Shewanella sp. MTB7]
MIDIKHVSVRINHKPVLTNINLQIKPGKVTALLGPNGAGKSTLLKCICQDNQLDAGQIALANRPIQDWDRLSLARNLAVLPQHASLTFPFEVHEVVAMGLYPLTLSSKQGMALIDEQLDLLALSALKHRSYPTLSGGEKQRVQLARVLTQLQQATQPPVLLLDEPTSALDLAQQHRVLSLARSLAHQQDYAVVVVLHDLNQASRYADELVILEHGQIVSQGVPGVALSPETIRQVWQYDPLVVISPDSHVPLLF